MTPETQKKVIDYMKLSSLVMEALAKQASERGQAYKAAQALIPAAVDALVKHKRIEESERKQAAEQLSDPAGALAILKNVAAHRSEEELAHIGKAAEKSAGVRQLKDSPYIGAASGYERESDRRFFERLGV